MDMHIQKGSNVSFDVVGIQECQRNRYPMLFIDKADVVVGEKVHAIKNFSYNELHQKQPIQHHE